MTKDIEGSDNFTQKTGSNKKKRETKITFSFSANLDKSQQLQLILNLSDNRDCCLLRCYSA